jgi:hypothetical protein
MCDEGLECRTKSRIVSIALQSFEVQYLLVLLRSQLNVKSVILSKEFFSLDRNFSPPKGPFCLCGELRYTYLTVQRTVQFCRRKFYIFTDLANEKES